MARVLLIIGDSAELMELKDGLEYDGNEIVSSIQGREGLNLALKDNFDIIILDTDMPDLQGCEVLREFRKTNKETPLIIVSKKKKEEDKIFCLNLGADDFLTKPVSVLELQARVRAQLRRVNILKNSAMTAGNMHPGYEPVTIKIGEASIFLDKMTARVNGHETALTPKEIGIVRLLYKNRGKVVPREMMMKEVWGENVYITERVIDTNVVSIRKKIGDAGRKSRYIKTVFGIGYKLSE